MKARLSAAFDKGIECILNTQIRVNRKPTIWCQQHDNITLKPAPARTFELPSFCTAESCSLVHLLMELPDPDERVKAAVNGAMEWLDLHKLYGIRVERFMTPEGKPDTHVVNLDMSVEMVTAGTIRLPNHSMKNINTGKKNICNLHIQPVL